MPVYKDGLSIPFEKEASADLLKTCILVLQRQTIKLALMSILSDLKQFFSQNKKSERCGCTINSNSNKSIWVFYLKKRDSKYTIKKKPGIFSVCN